MNGLNTKVSKKIPVEDGCMRCRDGSLTSTGLSAGNFDVIWGCY